MPLQIRALIPGIAPVGWLAALLGLALAQAAGAASGANAQSPLGINLGGVNYYASEMPFINDFLLASQWLTHEDGGAWDTNEQKYLNLDADGWPKTLTTVNEPSAQKFTSLGALIFRDLSATANGYYPAGKYIVLYEGKGKISYGFDAHLVSSAPGRDVLSVTPSTAGIEVKISATDPKRTGDYIRNIRLVSADNEAAIKAGKIFNPVFLERIQRFRALRFIDWLQINDSPLSGWPGRPLISNAFWGTAKGVPIEIAVQAANAVSADAWLLVPHMADDDYIKQMASLVHTTLGSSQKVYVEFSNEVWNGSFPQYQYAVARGQALWRDQPGGGGGFAWNRNWYGMRSAQTCDIWKSVWGEDGNRVVCVLAAQAANTDSAVSSLACRFWTQGAPCSRHGFGAVAIAPYFGYSGVPASWTTRSDKGLSDFFKSLESQNDASIPSGGSLHPASDWERAYMAVLAPYKLPLIAYEGGQGFANGPTPALTDLYIAANRDPRMATAYATYLGQWKANGGQLFMYYNDVGTASVSGAWGALESLMQTVTPLERAPPKWQGLQNFISANPCWWAACAGTVEAGR
jgi:hypothetical protein